MSNFKSLPSRAINNGIGYLAKFDNNYGASIVQHDFSYGHDQGLWELAVIKYDETDPDEWNICYTTPITADVLGYLTEEEVDETLPKIEALTE